MNEGRPGGRSVPQLVLSTFSGQVQPNVHRVVEWIASEFGRERTFENR